MPRRLPDTNTLVLDREAEDRLINLTEPGGAHDCWIHRRGEPCCMMFRIRTLDGQWVVTSTARIAFVLATGERLHEGIDVAHSCENTGHDPKLLCINPDHLFKEQPADRSRRVRRRIHVRRLRKTFMKELTDGARVLPVTPTRQEPPAPRVAVRPARLHPR